MEHPSIDPSKSYNFAEKGYRQLTKPMLVSLIGHLVLFTAMYFAPIPRSSDRVVFSAVNVELVSLPGSPLAEKDARAKPEPLEKQVEAEKKTVPEVSTVKKAAPTEEETVSVAPSEPEPEPAPDPEPEVSLAPKPKKPKRSLKKETFRPSAVVKRAIEKIKKETAEKPNRPKSRPVEDAIDKLKKEVSKTEPVKTASKNTGEKKIKKGYGGTRQGEGRGTGMTGALRGQMAVYNAEIIYQINRKWAFSEQLARGQKNIEAFLGIKISRTGEIQDIWFDKRSGNQYLDESAMRAVKKANPLPPIPRDFLKPYYVVGLRFTPRGLTSSR